MTAPKTCGAVACALLATCFSTGILMAQTQLAAFQKLPAYTNNSSPTGEIRRALIGLVDELNRGTSVQNQDAILLRLLGSYRLRHPATAESITQGSFLRLIPSNPELVYRPCSPRETDELADASSDRAPLGCSKEFEALRFAAQPGSPPIDESAFRQQVAAAFLDAFKGRADRFTQVLTAKFSGVPSELLTNNAPLLERRSSQFGIMDLGEIAEGLEADLKAASILANSNDPAAKGAAAALLYAAVNRLIWISGGQRITETTQRVPITQKAGGLGIEVIDQQPVFAPWDDAAYTSLRKLFPATFQVGPDGSLSFSGPIEENMGYLGDLLKALTVFLKLTGPGGQFSRFFVPDSEFVTNALDPSRPALFPQSVRAIAYRLTFVIMQNLFGRNGHIAIGEPLGLGLQIQEKLNFDSASTPRSATTRSFAKVVDAGHDFFSLINDFSRSDAQYPAALNGFKQRLGEIVFTGYIRLAAQNPCTDGGFGTQLDICIGPFGDQRGIRTTVSALTAITKEYNDGQQEFALVRILATWRYLNRFWTQQSVIPAEIVGLNQPVETTALWPILDLWDVTKVVVMRRLGPNGTNEINWDIWQSRIDGIRARLFDQLQRSEQGPAPMIP